MWLDVFPLHSTTPQIPQQNSCLSGATDRIGLDNAPGVVGAARGRARSMTYRRLARIGHLQVLIESHASPEATQDVASELVSCAARMSCRDFEHGDRLEAARYWVAGDIRGNQDRFGQRHLGLRQPDPPLPSTSRYRVHTGVLHFSGSGILLTVSLLSAPNPTMYTEYRSNGSYTARFG